MLSSPIAKTVSSLRSAATSRHRQYGTECRWARVLDDEPMVGSYPAGTSVRLGLVTDPENASEVEVRFIAEAAERTRVELNHRNVDRSGPVRPGAGWGAVRAGIDSEGGGPLYIDRYADLWLRKAEMPPVLVEAEVHRPAETVFTCATNPTRFSEWQNE